MVRSHLATGWQKLLMIALLLGTTFSEALAQTPASQRMTTELQFEVLYPEERPDPLVAQQWAEVFSKLEIPLRIRRPMFNDKVGTEQHVYGTIRRVKITGQLDRSGQINFADRRISLTDTAELAQWIENLQIYGEQGSPEGKPLWGLERPEFDRLHAGMKQTVSQSTAGLSMTDAIRALELPANYPLRFSHETRQQLAEKTDLPAFTLELQQVAKGTALSLLLNEYGLGFYPKRLPDESVVLTIEPLAGQKAFWPIGWNPDELGLKRLHVAAKMYLPATIGIEQTIMTDLLPRIEKETELKVFVDLRSQKELGLDFSKLVINFPKKQTSWTSCLRIILANMKLTHEVRVDENDRPFVWISKFDPKPVSRR